MKKNVSTALRFPIVMVTTFALMLGISQTKLARSSDVPSLKEETVSGFLDLFEDAERTMDRAGASSISLSEEAQAYIRSCCDDVETASALLKQAGFKLRYIDDPDLLSVPNRSYQATRGETFDAFISGSRGAGWWPWNLFTNYYASLLIRDGQLRGVSAQVSVQTL